MNDTTYYRKHRGWDGSTYYCRMPDNEVEERRKIGVIVGTILMPLFLVTLFVLASGVLHL